MTPPTVNAYYDPQNNNINFPAGILQPPFYDNKVDDAVNFGGIGAVIGHELTHGFDDQGRQFDAKGNLDDWWTETDAKQFTERADCIVKQYGSYSPIADVKLNGKLTLGENTADNGGLRIALMAMLDVITAANRDKKVDGYTPAQRFFLSWGQIWCTADREETSRMRAVIDPHSPGKFRVNGVLLQHAGVPEGVRLQGRPADGRGECLSGVVTAGVHSALIELRAQRRQLVIHRLLLRLRRGTRRGRSPLLERLDREGDALGLGIGGDHLHLDHLADLHGFARVLDVAVR